MKAISQFDILIKAYPGRTYYHIQKTINMQYVLRPGDKIAFVNYEGRGLSFRDVTIIDVGEECIVIRDDFYKGRVFTLNYQKEPNYMELKIADFKGEEDRKLIFRPFPTFNKIPKFKIIKKYSEDVFFKNCSLCNIRDYEPYLKNFNNIVDPEKSFFNGGVSLMTDRYINVPPDMIYPNPNNPRKTFDGESMAELVENVRQYGVLQPLVVVADKLRIPQMYRLVCGERRWRAATEARLRFVPVVVKELTEEQELEVMIIENLQRKDVDPIEEANGFKTLLDAGGNTQDDLAKKIGCSQAQIANRLRLLELPDSVRENISRGIISPSHGKVLAGFKQLPETILKKAAEHIAENNIPVAKTEELIVRTIIDQGHPLYKNYRCQVDFDTKGCRKCEHRLVVKETFYGGQEKAPYCINKPCWEEKQSEAAKKKRQAELEKVEAEARVAKERERQEADKKRSDNEAARIKLQEQIQKVTEQVQKVAPLLESSIQDPVINALILAGREIWRNEAGKSYYSDDANAVAMDRESIITLDGLLEYWQVKNEVCKDATSMPEQLGESTIIIQEQGIRFEGSEPYIPHNTEGVSRGALHVEGGKLKIINRNGQVLDQLPELPIYYRICSYQYASTKIIKQLVGIKTPTRTIIVFGSASATMRKEIFSLWIQLVNKLPAVYESAEGIIVPASELEPRRYLYKNGREIFVSAGIGGEEYGAFWRSHTGGLHRVKSPAMPVVSSCEEAQKNLDSWAEGMGLQQVEVAEGVA